MGLFGSKKHDAGKSASGAGRKSVTEVPPVSRKSVRRVVASTKTGSAVQRAPINPHARPAAVASPELTIEDVQLPPASIESEALDLGSGSRPAPADAMPAAGTGSTSKGAGKGAGKGGGTRPIHASSAPDFVGTLASPRGGGPSRTGDQVLLDFLTGKAGLLNAEQANAVRAKADGEGLALDEAAVRMGILTEEQLVNSLSQETWVPHLKVDKYEIRKKALDTVTREDAQHFGVFPVDKLGNLLTLAMVNPLDAEAIRQLEAKTGLDIKKVVATRGELASAIDKYYGGKAVASEGSRSFSQEVSDKPKSPTQMLSKGVEALAAQVAAPPATEITPPKPAAVSAHIAPDFAADIQDIDDLLGGEETIDPAIIEPVSIKPEESNDALDLTDAPITHSIRHENDLEFGLQEAPKSGTGALARSVLESARQEPTSSVSKLAARPGRGELRGATARVAAGDPGKKVVNLVPVLEEEFRYAISHGKSKVFERWVALQSRNRIVNAVSVEPELDGLLSGLYAGVRQAG